MAVLESGQELSACGDGSKKRCSKPHLFLAGGDVPDNGGGKRKERLEIVPKGAIMDL